MGGHSAIVAKQAISPASGQKLSKNEQARRRSASKTPPANKPAAAGPSPQATQRKTKHEHRDAIGAESDAAIASAAKALDEMEKRMRKHAVGPQKHSSEVSPLHIADPALSDDEADSPSDDEHTDPAQHEHTALPSGSAPNADDYETEEYEEEDPYASDSDSQSLTDTEPTGLESMDTASAHMLRIIALEEKLKSLVAAKRTQTLQLRDDREEPRGSSHRLHRPSRHRQQPHRRHRRVRGLAREDGQDGGPG